MLTRYTLLHRFGRLRPTARVPALSTQYARDRRGSHQWYVCNMSLWNASARSHRCIGSTADLSKNLHVTEGAISSVAQMEYLPPGVVRQSDFFGECVTFIKNLDKEQIQSLGVSGRQDTVSGHKSIPSEISTLRDTNSHQNDPSEVLSSFDNMSLCIISKGSANIHSGNDGEGPEIRAQHASAVAWAELVKHSSKWNRATQEDNASIIACPMLAVAAVAPLLAQSGIHYLHRIDRLLASSEGALSLLDAAQYATSFRDAFVLCGDSESMAEETNSAAKAGLTPILSPRERWHLHALNQLLQNNHRQAMGAYLRLLELYPGDLIGLSLAIDVAYTLGDADLALRAATNVSAYWAERDGGSLHLNHSHPAQPLATSLLAVGLASSSSSRAQTAERLAETALARDSDGTGGTSVWALSHSLASEGRSQEMISKLATSDGTQLYEASGYLAFHTRLMGYGAIAILDRQGAACHRSAIRMYDGSFGRTLEYSGNNAPGYEGGGELVYLNKLSVPRDIKKEMAGEVESMFSSWFSIGATNSAKQHSPDLITENNQVQIRSIESTLCWLPPSPILLSQATALLLRLTLCDAISPSDDRWVDMAAAWEATLETGNNSASTFDKQTPIEFMPLGMLASSLLIEPKHLHYHDISPDLEYAMIGLHKMGNLMKLGQLNVDSTWSSIAGTAYAEEWREILTLLARARDTHRWEMPSGSFSKTYLQSDLVENEVHRLCSRDSSNCNQIGWAFDVRQFIEYPLCFAAMKVGDYESLCLARSVCSEGTTLRPSCPELWWRYGTILEMMGDDVAAENAKAASLSLGGGEGSTIF